MSALDDIEKLLGAMRDRGAEMAAFEGLLTSISQSMADIVTIMERPEAPEAPEPEDTALIAALERLQIPAPVVNVSPAITVQPANVTIMPGQTGTISGTMSKGRDGSWAFSITRG